MSTNASVIVAAGLLIVVFGIGIGVGRSAQVRQLPSIMQNAKTQRHAGVARELAMCQEELAEQAAPRTTASVQAPEDAKSAAVESVARVDVLEEELKQCRKRDFLHNIDMCIAPDRYHVLFLVSLHADQACVDKFGVADLILRHLEMCPNFREHPPEYGMDDFSGTDSHNVYRAVDELGRAPDRVGNMARHIKRSFRECRTKFGHSND